MIPNSFLSGAALKQHCVLGLAKKTLLKQSIDSAHLSVRASYRLLKVARSIADMDEVDAIGVDQLIEGLGYRG